MLPTDKRERCRSKLGIFSNASCIEKPREKRSFIKGENKNKKNTENMTLTIDKKIQARTFD